MVFEDVCVKYLNMCIFDWVGVVKDFWYILDGIYYILVGYKVRV